MIMLKEDSTNCKLEGFCLEGQKAEAVDQGQYGIAVQGTHHRLINMTVHDINYFPNDWIGSDIGYGSVNAPAYGVAIYNASDIHVNGGVFYCSGRGI